VTWKLSRTVLKPSRSGDAPAQAAPPAETKKAQAADWSRRAQARVAETREGGATRETGGAVHFKCMRLMLPVSSTRS
jgi:hypothetical protein